MRALTLQQPWASLIAYGEKRFETRSWRTWYSGPIAIHAGKTFGMEPLEMLRVEPFKSVLLEHGLLDGSMPLGCVVAIAEITGWSSAEMPHLRRHLYREARHEMTFGNFAAGRFAWHLTNVRRLATPIPARGKQGLWDWELPEGTVLVPVATRTAA